MSQNRKTISLKWGLAAAFVVCWVAAILIVISIAGILINFSFGRTSRASIEKDAANILSHIDLRLSAQINSSKSISYDGVIRDAYRQFLQSEDENVFYRTSSEYITQKFSRDPDLKAIFLSFWDDSISSHIYQVNQPYDTYAILSEFRDHVRPQVLELMKETDTGIRFFVHNGEFYLCRNLVDSRFQPYATISMLCDTELLFQSIHSAGYIGKAHLSLDGINMIIDGDGMLQVVDESPALTDTTMVYTTDIEDHAFSFSVEPPMFNIWRDMPGLPASVASALALILPLIVIVFLVFYVTVSRPMEALLNATSKVQDGEWGYQIREQARSTEFSMLYSHFNAMSANLRSQVDHSIEEQRALQQAQIKALQSQINPHFLNNTLEIINWEARLADCDSVAEMIEALSTMLDAALDRKGANLIPLRQELQYVDAYLFIIRKRLGDSFVVEKHIDESIYDCIIPRLVLQPLAENAVDHDLVPNRGGLLSIHGWREDGRIFLSMEHDGVLSEKDRENIDRMLQDPSVRRITDTDTHIGLNNVYARLKLLYGSDCRFSIEQQDRRILCVISFPEKQ